MAELIVTFGQCHTHKVMGKTFNCDCVAVIKADTVQNADKIAFEVFKGQFHQHVNREKWDDSKMHYFPRGYIEVN